VARLIGAARYPEVERLVRAMEHNTAAAGEAGAAQLLAAAREVCVACQDQHMATMAHRQAAADGAVTESQLRLRLTMLLQRAVGSEPTIGAAGPSSALPQGSSVSRGAVAVYGLGPLQVFARDRDLGPMPNRRAKSVFKYLLLNRGRPTPKEVLMELFWPEAAASAARNNLNVAVHGLRRFLRGPDGPDTYVLFQDNAYLLNPAVEVWVDLDEFERRTAAARELRIRGDVLGAVRELEIAEALYRGALFEDDPYEDWTAVPRRAAEDRYVEVLGALGEGYGELGDDGACIRVARKVLDVQPANEVAHRDLMRCYVRLGQHHLALRQYRDCAERLRSELDIAPGRETVRLYEEVRARRSG
jgi:DNA-binding SARP family transcriptional activator